MLVDIWQIKLRIAHALRTDAGEDFQSQVMGGGLFDTTMAGTATASGATSLTDAGQTWTVNRHRGKIVVASSDAGSNVYGIIQSNTGTVLTVDRWYNASTPDGAAGTTPASTAKYQVLSGGHPAFWIAFTEDAGAPAVGDVQLTAELVVGTSAGLERHQGTWAHTAGVASYTLSSTRTLTGATPRTLEKAGMMNQKVDTSTQYMVFETLMPNPPTLVTNDQITTTWTITL